MIEICMGGRGGGIVQGPIDFQCLAQVWEGFTGVSVGVSV